MNDRCNITGNPCGTDTWQNGRPCRCAPCTLYVSESRREAAEALLRDMRGFILAQAWDQWAIPDIDAHFARYKD